MAESIKKTSDPYKAATLAVRARLPPGWSVSTAGRGSRSPRLRITSSEGRSGEIPVATLQRIDPRIAKALPRRGPLLVTAPYLSRGVREILGDREASFADQTGNVRLVLDEPGLFIETAGADSNPWPAERRFSLRGAKSGQVIEELVRSDLPIGVRELAARAGTDAGYVSRLVRMLDREALIDRSPRGRVERTDWRKLLARWSEEAPIESRSSASTWLAPRGLKALWDGLRSARFRYLITGSAAADLYAPVAPTRVASIYVADSGEAANALGLRPAEAGANVILLEQDDPELFTRGQSSHGLRYASLPLVVADLLSGPGRSPAEAEALMDWMAEHLDRWRG